MKTCKVATVKAEMVKFRADPYKRLSETKYEGWVAFNEGIICFVTTEDEKNTCADFHIDIKSLLIALKAEGYRI